MGRLVAWAGRRGDTSPWKRLVCAVLAREGMALQRAKRTVSSFAVAGDGDRVPAMP